MRILASHRFLDALARDRRGVVGLYFAVILSALMLLSIAALDLIRYQLVRAHMSIAMDSALLAAGKALGTDRWSTDGVAFFNANMDGSIGPKVTVKEEDFKQTVGLGTETVSLSVKTSVPMMSAGLGNIAALDVDLTSSATRRSQTVDIALVLDNTGSMGADVAGSKIDALRIAADNLVTIVATEVKKDGSKVYHDPMPWAQISVVPYAAAVNPGSLPGVRAYIEGNPVPSSAPLGWRGCVVERPGKDYTLTANLSSTVKWKPYVWAPAGDNDYVKTDANTVFADPKANQNDSTGPNVGCPTPIQALTSQTSVVKTAISNMTAWYRGGTLSDIGMAWGLRTLTATPGNVYGPASPFFGNRMQVVVLMTDGEANFNKLTSSTGRNDPINTLDGKAVLSDYTGYDRLDWSGLVKGTHIVIPDKPSPLDNKDIANKDEGIAQVEANLSLLCDTMKNAFGIRVYTVTFNVPSNTVKGQRTKDLYRACASNPSFYTDAQGNAQLNEAFKNIAGQVTELVLTQ
ncbi:MAG: TadE/TadG family type IV pilus assembly protein [Bacteroidales bacterium]